MLSAVLSVAALGVLACGAFVLREYVISPEKFNFFSPEQ